jgi:hypothetical protein
MGLRSVAAVALAVGASGLLTGFAYALECHSKAVSAKGGPGLIEATAKSRARSTWIKKVRSDRRLGRQYAAWLRARDPSYACRKIGRHIACEASATPCRLEPASQSKGR